MVRWVISFGEPRISYNCFRLQHGKFTYRLLLIAWSHCHACNIPMNNVLNVLGILIGLYSKLSATFLLLFVLLQPFIFAIPVCASVIFRRLLSEWIDFFRTPCMLDQPSLSSLPPAISKCDQNIRIHLMKSNAQWCITIHEGAMIVRSSGGKVERGEGDKPQVTQCADGICRAWSQLNKRSGFTRYLSCTRFLAIDI